MKLIPHQVILVHSIPPCWFCQRDGVERPGPYDFATRIGMGGWADGCEMHWKAYRASDRLGMGLGQLRVTADQLDEPADEPVEDSGKLWGHD